MSLVRIDVSHKQLAKLRRGHKVRVKPAMEGSGFNLIIDPDRYDTITRTFGRGKGMELALSPKEVQINADNQEHPAMEGRGIFSTVKHLGKKALHIAKPHLVEATKKSLTGALTAGGTALAVANPALAPVIPLGVAGLSHLGHKAIDRFTSNAGGSKSLSPATLAGQLEQNHMYDHMNNELGTKYGALAKASLGNALAHHQRAEMTGNIIHHQGGTGLYAGGMRGGRIIGRSQEMGSVGRGAGFVSHQTGLPPALQSQPFASNFQFQHFLPPAYQKFSKGAGLYA